MPRWIVTATVFLGLLLVACGARVGTGGVATPTARSRSATFVLRAAPVLGIVVDREGRVVGVEAGGAAEGAGFRPGDRVVAINGATVASAGEAKDRVRSAGAGAPLIITVERGDRTLTLTATPGGRAGQPGQPTPTPVPGDLDYF